MSDQLRDDEFGGLEGLNMRVYFVEVRLGLFESFIADFS